MGPLPLPGQHEDDSCVWRTLCHDGPRQCALPDVQTAKGVYAVPGLRGRCLRNLRPVRTRRLGLRVRVAGLLLPRMRLEPDGEPECRLSRPAGRARTDHRIMTTSFGDRNSAGQRVVYGPAAFREIDTITGLLIIGADLMWIVHRISLSPALTPSFSPQKPSVSRDGQPLQENVRATATHSFLFTDWLDRAMMTLPMQPTEGKAHRGNHGSSVNPTG